MEGKFLSRGLDTRITVTNCYADHSEKRIPPTPIGHTHDGHVMNVGYFGHGWPIQMELDGEEGGLKVTGFEPRAKPFCMKQQAFSWQETLQIILSATYKERLIRYLYKVPSRTSDKKRDQLVVGLFTFFIHQPLNAPAGVPVPIQP